MSNEPKIDEEFARLCFSHTRTESEWLEFSLKRDGLLAPLVVWKETGILLDGHERLRICKQLAIPYTTIEVSLRGRADAMLWIMAHEMASRKLSPPERAMIVGRCRKALRQLSSNRNRKAKAKTASATKASRRRKEAR